MIAIFCKGVGCQYLDLLHDSDWTNRELLSRFEGVLGKLTRVAINLDVSLLTVHVKEVV
jgi:hypothetical protein